MGAKVSKYLSNVIYLAKFLVLGLLEFSTTSNPHAARENLPRLHLVALWNLFLIVLFHSTALPCSGKIIIKS